jgi:integrase
VQLEQEREVVFADLVAPTLAMHQGRVDRGEFTQNSLRMLRNRLQRYVVPVLGQVAIQDFGYQHGADFMQKLSAKGNSSVTIQQYLVAIRKVLTHAMATGYIKVVPKLPNITIKSKPRGSFSLQEYRLLVTHARRLIGDVIPIHATQRSKYGPSRIGRYEYIHEDLQYLIVFMVNSFIRPTDLKNMKHEHVTIVRGEHVYLRLNLPESKKHDKPIVTMRPAVRAYERLLARDLVRGYGKPEDYVFMPELWDRLVMIMRYGYQLQRVQEVAGVGVNKSNGMKRTLYSLRHTAITLRLLYGGNIDLLTLARNARTSVEMIETYYSSNLTGEMNIGLLQGKRGK